MGRIGKRRSWSWPVPVPPAALWSLLADTQRFNEAAGLPRHEIDERSRSDGTLDYRARASFGPFRLSWRETPVNWVAPRWLVHRRDFDNGPLKLLIASLFFEPEGEGTRFRVEIEAAPRGLLGRFLLSAGFFRASGRMYREQLEAAVAHLQGMSPKPFKYKSPPPGELAQRRGEELALAVEESGYGHGKAERLLRYLFEAQESDLVHLRPLGFARMEEMGEREAIELFLQSTRLGLLELRWDLLCPRCRVPKAAAPGLDKLPSGAHCSSCNIDYERDFSRNVELSFSPAAAIRPIASGEYCLFGPGSTPHVLAQLAVHPGETRKVAADLPPGRYRLRTLEAGGAVDLDHEGGPFAKIIIKGNEVRAGESVDTEGLVLSNESPYPRVAVVEERRWARDALTADRVTSLQAFRDLFSDQVLRPGDEVALHHIALLFTDLKSSTALYNRVGDAAAYHSVRRHFAFLAAIVRRHDGAVVKTIGDAVMASFLDPAAALAAALEIQGEIARFNAGEENGSIVLKLGLHAGSAIAVTLNGRLDYFGASVNMAARLQGESKGGDIVCSLELAADPGVAALLPQKGVRREQALLKGFVEPVEFIRLGPFSVDG